MSTKRIFIKAHGIVQGVGFRPFVYNLAVSLNLKGWVNNNSEGVYIDLEGSEENLESFIGTLKNNPPPLAKVERIDVESRPVIDFTDFCIKESEKNENRITLISPDIALCNDCKNDILDPHNRRYRYPFTNCTNCGPRFSIIKSIPYDRDKTTMKKFQMCTKCEKEYTDPSNRRFHAQPNACRDCGPELWIVDTHKKTIDIGSNSIDPITWTQEKLMSGKIFAIKGLTGFHLACDAKNEVAVKTLRVRKRRPHKPLAVMMKNIETVKKYCEVSKAEESLLTGIRKPIVLLNRSADYSLPEDIAPNQKTLGVMLPYTPLHELLFQGAVEVLVMTSANIYGLPIEYDNDSALEKLSNIVDYFLMHNRDIFIPVDDSVVRMINGKERLIRRARGYAPEPFKTAQLNDILCCGSNMKNTFSLAKGEYVFLSQHNGDLENLETNEHYSRNIDHFKNIFDFDPKYIAHDLHPEYNSTIYAESYVIPKIPVQHHHAHIASCLAENGISSRVIGIAFDGTGFGTDEKIWGGEFLICDLKGFERFANLDYTLLPGGEKAIKEPWRMAVSYILKAFKEDLAHNIIYDLYGNDGLNLIPIIQKKINCIETSSMGRFLDACASIAAAANSITYEGQASIEFEASLKEDCIESYDYSIEPNTGSSSLSKYIIDTDSIILELVNDRMNNLPASIMSAKIHNTIINFTIDVCKQLRIDTGVNEVALSGGVFQNAYLLDKLIDKLTKENFIVYSQSVFPSNDGGISLGQMVVANEIINKNRFR